MKLTLSLALGISLVACNNEDPAEVILPSKTSVCSGQIKNKSYIIQWNDNSVTTVSDVDRETLKEDFVRPNLSEIRRVEYEQVLNISQFETKAVTQIDNWGYKQIHAADFWQAGFRGQGVLVAVIDSGVDVIHPHLQNRIETNEGEAGELATNGIDDDHNGFVDDYLGYNFHAKSADLTDNVFHGTHVAGIIAGEHSENSVVDNELLGMAPQAKILPVKFLDETGGTLSAAIQAIGYAATRGAKIINASWGGSGCSEILRDKIAEVTAQGILFVVASGNSGNNIDKFPEYPAAFQDTLQITVGAISPFLGMTNFSNYSDQLVHLFAPGQDIVSTVPGGVASLSGTSMATPFVVGAAALILSANPSLSLPQLREKLLKAVVQDNNYRNVTRGRIDLSRAINSLN